MLKYVYAKPQPATQREDRLGQVYFCEQNRRVIYYTVLILVGPLDRVSGKQKFALRRIVCICLV
jgi:hypothetical protein